MGMNLSYCTNYRPFGGEQPGTSSHVSEELLARRVLVVDDENLIRWSLVQTLSDHGFAVEEAANGADAVKIAAASGDRFDVVLLDFRLPDSNDLKLLARMKQLLPHAALILMTAFSTPEVARSALDLGAVRVVHKPFEMNDMAKFVKQAC
ncbi:MAG TPA: response regulator [Vicinamibacterales bacterium]|nr:response regulator [Vicinamibacterales bacterium]